MFGYIQINQKELKIREYETYRSYYCGLCHLLKEKYARTGQLMLNYDMTFLAMLLDGLYEPEKETARRRCVPHLAAAHPETITGETGYAADMTILLGYAKAVDDWRDDRSLYKRVLAGRLHPEYGRLKERYPRQAQMLERCMKRLLALEREGCTDLDLVSAQTGYFLGEIFASRDDVWQDDLREMGFYLGKFIYLMDAADDFGKDKKRHRYNILHSLTDDGCLEFTGDPALVDTTAAILTDMMARASRAFERLPVLQNVEILRNILYSGVWMRFAAIRNAGSSRQKQE